MAVINLNCSLLFSQSRSFMFFHRVKEPKRLALAKSVTTAFCSRVASGIPRLAVVFHKQLFVQASGTKQLAFHAMTATRVCTAQTNFVLFPLLDRLFTVILIVPVFSLILQLSEQKYARCATNPHYKGNPPLFLLLPPNSAKPYNIICKINPTSTLLFLYTL